MIEIYKIKFNNREAFESALCILENSDCNNFYHDIRYDDMVIAFCADTIRYDFVTELANFGLTNHFVLE